MASINSKPQIIFMVALASEAKPIIDFYRLKKNKSHSFAHYSSEQDECFIDLVVSGIGLLSMAAAVGWAAGSLINTANAVGKMSNVAWLNIGTAGHATRELGELLLINSVAGDATSRTYYPPLVCKWSGDTESLISVNTPSNHYPPQAAVDMEALAFFNSAARFSSSELVQSIKVVSDNASHGFENLNAQKLSDYIHQNINAIASFVDRLTKLCLKQPLDNSELIKAPEGVHFTVSQQHQWSDLTRKVAVMSAQSSLDLSALDSADSAKRAITILSDALNCTVPDLAEH